MQTLRRSVGITNVELLGNVLNDIVLPSRQAQIILGRPESLTTSESGNLIANEMARKSGNGASSVRAAYRAILGE